MMFQPIRKVVLSSMIIAIALASVSQTDTARASMLSAKTNYELNCGDVTGLTKKLLKKLKKPINLSKKVVDFMVDQLDAGEGTEAVLALATGVIATKMAVWAKNSPVLSSMLNYIAAHKGTWKNLASQTFVYTALASMLAEVRHESASEAIGDIIEIYVDAGMDPSDAEVAAEELFAYFVYNAPRSPRREYERHFARLIDSLLLIRQCLPDPEEVPHFSLYYFASVLDHFNSQYKGCKSGDVSSVFTPTPSSESSNDERPRGVHTEVIQVCAPEWVAENGLSESALAAWEGYMEANPDKKPGSESEEEEPEESVDPDDKNGNGIPDDWEGELNGGGGRPPKGWSGGHQGICNTNLMLAGPVPWVSCNQSAF